MSTYRSASVLEELGGERRLGLATADGLGPEGLVENPTFFSGFVTRPDVVSAGILAVADLAASRYADLGVHVNVLAADPVVTAGGEVLRFESFSLCNGVYARLDLTREGLGSAEVGFGTTNVDVNVGLRRALAGIGRAEPLHLAVGRDELRASTPAATHVERKVRLPDRWVRGLAEVPALSSASRAVGEARGSAAVGRFLASLPRVQPPGPDVHLVALQGGMRATTTSVHGSARVSGVGRLQSLHRLARHALSLTVYAHEHGTSTWVLTLPGGRFTLSLSPDVCRGFSGEGTLLTLLSHPSAEESGRRLLDLVRWEACIDEDELIGGSGLPAARVRAGLAWLAASGRLGHDVAEGRWFHRELPVDGEAVLRRAPRLTKAARLPREGAVVDVGAGSPAGLRCSCPWETKHGPSRGPCSHALAVVLLLRANLAAGA